MCAYNFCVCVQPNMSIKYYTVLQICETGKEDTSSGKPNSMTACRSLASPASTFLLFFSCFVFSFGLNPKGVCLTRTPGPYHGPPFQNAINFFFFPFLPARHIKSPPRCFFLLSVWLQCGGAAAAAAAMNRAQLRECITTENGAPGVRADRAAEFVRWVAAWVSLSLSLALSPSLSFTWCPGTTSKRARGGSMHASKAADAKRGEMFQLNGESRI